MPEENQEVFEIPGWTTVQRRTTDRLRKREELQDGLNLSFSKIIGGISRRDGSQQLGSDITDATTTSTTTSTTSTSTSSSTSTTSTSTTTTTSTSTSTTTS